MNEITLENTRDALRFNRHVIEVPRDIARRARRAIERMLEIG
jgi:quinolinate synthase